jgi:NAD(P)-dependent dehydrogenase (short-subunit alcohol dehydrogenase family)
LSAICITGATGQVDGALVNELVGRGAQVLAMVRTEDRPEGFASRAGVERIVKLSANGASPPHLRARSQRVVSARTMELDYSESVPKWGDRR